MDIGDHVRKEIPDTLHEDQLGEEVLVEHGQGDDTMNEEGEGLDSKDDSDYLEDEENHVSDIEVDMTDFHMSIDVDAEYVERGNSAENADDDAYLEDVEVIDNNDCDSFREDNCDERRKSILKQLGKERRCSLGEVHAVTFHVGQKYKSKKEIKAKVNQHAIETRRNLFFKKNDKVRLRVQCRGNVPDLSSSGVGGSSKGGVGGRSKANKVTCTWAMQASRSKNIDLWFVKTLILKHTCLQTRKLRACTAKFISKEIMDQVESNPTVPLRTIQEHVQKRYEVGVSLNKVQRAKATTTLQVVGDYRKQYDVLRDYILELQATNEATTVKLEVVGEPNLSSETRQFKRIYVCFGALKNGFKSGLREILGLDGCFMKGPFPGQLLTAVGVDSNNGIYPIAYAIVEAENTSSWKWFLECLGEDSEPYANSNFTFIIDRQKGLLHAIAKVCPCAEHRFCVRHIHENMRKIWKAREYRDHLWKCATATTVPEFEGCMTEFSHFDREAFEWLKKIPPQHWARSHISVTYMLLNNLCEVFNGNLINGRDKPIISSLEFFRQYLLKRICNVMKVMAKAEGPLTPTAIKLLERNSTHAVQYIARWNGTSKFKVHGPWHDQHVVYMKELTCTCRRWELNGIPCKHAIATINKMDDSGESVGELYTYVHKCYWLEIWKHAYSYKVDPIKGRVMWPKSSCPLTLTPPPHHNQPGRPKIKRKRALDESQSQTEKRTRSFVSVTCSKCKNMGHNSRSCKG